MGSGESKTAEHCVLAINNVSTDGGLVRVMCVGARGVGKSSLEKMMFTCTNTVDCIVTRPDITGGHVTLFSDEYLLGNMSLYDTTGANFLAPEELGLLLQMTRGEIPLRQNIPLTNAPTVTQVAVQQTQPKSKRCHCGSKDEYLWSDSTSEFQSRVLYFSPLVSRFAAMGLRSIAVVTHADAYSWESTRTRVKLRAAGICGASEDAAYLVDATCGKKTSDQYNFVETVTKQIRAYADFYKQHGT